MEATQLFEAGHSRAEVARLCAVTWRSAHEWHRAWSAKGASALKATTRPGPAPKFSEEELGILEKELRRGPLAHGYDNELWTLPRVGRLVAEIFDKKASQSEVWRLLRRMRWSPQKPRRKARERDEEKIAQ
jgi:putative transposase